MKKQNKSKTTHDMVSAPAKKLSRLPRSYALFAFRLNFDPENHKIFFIGSVVQFDHFKLLPEAQQLRLNPGILWGSLKILQSSPPRPPQKS